MLVASWRRFPAAGRRTPCQFAIVLNWHFLRAQTARLRAIRQRRNPLVLRVARQAHSRLVALCAFMDSATVLREFLERGDPYAEDWNPVRNGNNLPFRVG